MKNNLSKPETEVLESRECWSLLRDVSLGRLAVWVDDHPEIFPVNIRVVDGALVFRTGPGTKLTAALGENPVALEADGIDADAGVAWSVMVKGRATAAEHDDELLSSAARLLFPWEAGPKDHFVRITADSITGRRFKVAAPRAWSISLDDATRAGLE
ncbi:pyridoxamine 5'-phosphate oxidase family protein [Arthrobacter sp. I2-34]|uniref:Pyridoxamine 5'-phosphate oxidase family protein n=1 Tax=Arthrobacter hankyongi TaxID=2904801 RepID=A0ABS9L6N6_9MICC|nr:pyridoxamine 5'-phosphate oxidase family protein [Arthrobacter hankyongi]MCG2622173.1 pyridoxamine 5'-phosphate oxidase family protein [Arthrobacter hankyongi]